MKIGFITAEFVFGDHVRGGLGNYLNRLTNALAESEHEPHVFYYTDLPAGDHLEKGVNIHILNNNCNELISLLNLITRNRFRQTLDGIERALRFRRYLNRYLQENRLDIIQVPSSNFAGLFISKRVPIVIRGNSYRPLVDKFDRVTQTLDRRIYLKLEELQYKRADGIFVPTRFLADLLGKILKIKSIEVIRSPYFQETLATDDSLYKKYLKNKVYLLFFGRLSPLKGAQVLADALPKVWEIHPDLFAVFIGEDRRLDKKTTVKAYIQEKCVNNLDKTLFLPLTPHEKLYPIIEHARLVVLPSFFDNSPNTLLEAMGFGKPVVGTYGSSMDEFIEDGVSGFLVQPGDPDALAEKIYQAWSRPDLEKIGQKAKEALNSHSVEKVLPELLHFYRKHLQS